MNVNKKVITTYTIMDAPGHSDILVTIEDIGPSKGRVQMQEGAQVATAFWNGMGNRTAAEFVKAASPEFLLSSFDQFGTQYRKVLAANAKTDLACAIGERVEAGHLNEADAEQLLSRLSIFDTISDINGVQVIAADLMQQIFGPGWPEYARPLLLGKHPHYIGLIERISLLQEVVSS